MKETSFKAGVIGGVFTFLALFATTSKASINEYLAKVIKEWKSLETQGWCG